VLAGHSFGGLYVRSFATQFPDDVAGMVFLDSTAAIRAPPRHPSLGPTTPSVASPRCCLRWHTSESDA
jgi:pimeloyl-ACP methyl ester carboxylesterase